MGSKYHIGVDNQLYYVNRIIWKMMTGEDPVCIVDHQDRNKANLRWSNLREATYQQNAVNSKRNGKRVSGVYRDGKKWYSKMYSKGIRYHLGWYDTREEAEEARIAKEIELWGKFSIHYPHC